MSTLTTYHFWRTTSDGEGWSHSHHSMATAERLARLNGAARVCQRTLTFEALPAEAIIAGVVPRVVDEVITEHTLRGGHHDAA